MTNAEHLAVPSDQELDLDRYAAILAHTIHFRTAPTGEVLARLDVPEKRWNEAHAKWTRILVEEAAEDEAPTARQFGAAFAIARTRLREERPTLESLGPLPVVDASRPTEPVFVEAQRAPFAPSPPTAAAPPPQQHALEVEAAVPSYMLAPTAPTPAPLAPAFAPLLAPPSLAPQPERVALVQHTHLRVAADSSGLPARPAMPFNAGGTPEQALADVIARMTAAQGAPPTESGKPPRAHLGETVGVAPFPVGRALPFATNAAGPAAPSWMPAGMLKLASVEGTQLSTDATPGPALPFEPAKSSQIALEDALAQTARLQGPAPGPTKEPGLAGTMGPGNPLDLRKPELPFSSSPPPILSHALTLSMERYASLCVELSAPPANAVETLRRYQLTEPEWITLDASWKARLSREPGARAAWENACSAYRTWLIQSSRGNR